MAPQFGEEWVVADWHFGHENIIRYCKRPFLNVDRMDAEIIKRHNAVVNPFDKVYVIGDVTLKGADRKGWVRRLLSKMHGRKVLVFGNHDDWHWQQYLDVGFESCHTFLELPYTETVDTGIGPMEETTTVRLCHDPAWAQDPNYIWVCGHLHNNFFSAPSHIKIVSVELTDYQPIRMKDILAGWEPKPGTMRVPPRPNRVPSEWEGKAAYDPNFGNERICKCGHTYYRHFDSYDDMAPIGCKYCQCGYFEELPDECLLKCQHGVLGECKSPVECINHRQYRSKGPDCM